MRSLQKIVTMLTLCIHLLVPATSIAAGANSQSVYDRDYRIIYSYAQQVNANLDAAWADWIAQTILYFCAQYGVDPLLATALIAQESSFNPNAYSPAGAFGFAQLEPATAAAVGVRIDDPAQNIQGGIIYLRNQLDNFQYAGIWANDYAIAAYNCGPARIREYNGIPPYTETINHVIRVGERYRYLVSQL